jgi:hypothetical protein
MLEDLYFSEREACKQTRTQETIGAPFWGGFIATIRARLSDGSFAEDFPVHCFEATYPTESDDRALGLLFRAEVADLSWPLNPDEVPETLTILDGVEFFARHISRPAESVNHSYGRHFHILSFDRAAGLAGYVTDLNRLFRRCCHPFEIESSGHVRRIGPPILHETLSTVIFQTGDSDLDRLLNVAREKFFDPDQSIRAEGLEKLWDAWERLKTLLPGDKRTSITKLLDQAVPESNLRERVEQEANALTKIGNDFMIRHTETNKTPIQRSTHLDYLFHRLFALMWMVLKSRGAAGT